MKNATILLTFIWVVIQILPASAYAASIINLANTPQTIEIETASGYTTISIDTGHVYQVPGIIRVRFKDKVSSIDYNEEYTIWNDGTFGPQKVEHFFKGGL